MLACRHCDCGMCRICNGLGEPEARDPRCSACTGSATEPMSEARLTEIEEAAPLVCGDLVAEIRRLRAENERLTQAAPALLAIAEAAAGIGPEHCERPLGGVKGTCLTEEWCRSMCRACRVRAAVAALGEEADDA